MSFAPSTDPDLTQTATSAKALEQAFARAAAEFEARLRAGERPRIEDWFDRVPTNCQEALAEELLKVEIEFDRAHHREPVPDQLRSRFPVLADRILNWIAESAQPTPERSEPKQFGPYLIQGRLGEGGQAIVLQGRHEVLGSLAAIKVLLPDRVNPRTCARFLAEARLLASTSHPNLVRALHAGEQDGSPFLAMEFLQGETVRDLLKREGRLSLSEGISIARQTALALDHLAGIGIVHRDVKPANLMRMPDGGVKLLDLGLARRVEMRGQDPELELTQAGEFLGTFLYASPEQFNAAGEVDHRADLYALGCTLMHVLSGSPPFRTSTASELAEAHLSQPPPWLRDRLPGIPAELDDLVHRLLAKKPDDRPSSAHEVIDTLDGILGAESTVTGFAKVSQSDEHRAPKSRGWRDEVFAHRRLLVSLSIAAAMLFTAILLLSPSVRSTALNVTVATNTDPKPKAPDSQGEPNSPVSLSTAPVSSTSKSPIQVIGFHVEHYSSGTRQDVLAGDLGRQSFAVKTRDKVRIRAELSEPAYCFLIVFRPDGEDDVCFPETADAIPEKTAQPRYPIAAADVTYGFDEGPGLCSFALVVSQEPLPSYREWRSMRSSPLPWRSRIEGQIGVVYRYDGDWFYPLTSSDPEGLRGKGRRLQGVGPTLFALTNWLKADPRVESVQLLAVPVIESVLEKLESIPVLPRSVR